jgi:hypothetical protein
MKRGNDPSILFALAWVGLLALLVTLDAGARLSGAWAITQGAGQSAAAPAFVEEKGKFRVTVGGAPAGQEQFSITLENGNWVAGGSAEVRAPDGPTTRVTGTLTLKPDGTPVRYQWSTQGAKKASATVDFSGGVATIELRLEGEKPFTQQFFFPSPRVVILDNNLFHQYAILARLYDWARKGEQDFPVLVPQTMTPGSIKVQSIGKEAVDGRPLEVLRVKTEDLEVFLYLDGLRLVRIAAPASNAEAARE